MRGRELDTLGLQAFEVKRDGVGDLSLNVGAALGRRDTTRYVRGVGGEAAFRLLNYDEVL